MSKELDLEQLELELEYAEEQCNTNLPYFRQALKSLTPPTEEELCEELSAYMKEPVWFDNNKTIRISTQWLVKKIGKYGLEFLAVLPPRLIKRIAMFYESESERE